MQKQTRIELKMGRINNEINNNRQSFATIRKRYFNCFKVNNRNQNKQTCINQTNMNKPNKHE